MTSLIDLLGSPGEPARELRDTFAAAAMQAMLTGYYTAEDDDTPNAQVIAEWSYYYADAMMAARRRPVAKNEGRGI